jgi:alcohol dehydrogenase class IV
MHLTHKLKVIGCRVFQGGLKVANYFLNYRMPQCLEGPGKVRELGAFLKEKGINDVLVVTGSGMVRRGQVKPLLDGFEASGICYTVQTYDRTDPTSDDVELGYRTFRENGCRAIVALGGGSRIDCAKGIAAKAARPDKRVSQLQGILRVLRRGPVVVAIPTTAGAGSETTVAAVITDTATHRKAAINDPVLIPDYAVLDPELTVDLPPHTTATTGMDALAHAVEAYTNKTYNTKLEDQLAKEAVKRIHGNILLAFEDGSNLEARQNMQWAAFCAGRAFTRGCVGYVHAIGHTLGSLYGVSHGLAMAVLLPHVLRAYGSPVHKRLAELAEVCGISGNSDEEKAEAFIRWIEETNIRMGLPAKFSVVKDKDIDQMIKWASKEANPLYPVPVIWGREDFRKLIKSACK